MVIFNNWTLSETGGVLAHQYDNKTRALLVAGDLPDGWTWDMLVSVGDNLDIIRLSPMEGGVGVILTAEMLSMTGYYVMQLRGTQGELVRHTNQMTVFIPPSLSGDANWPEVPSEFSQMEERINEAVEHYPQIGEGGTWEVYDPATASWEDTGVSAAGQEGKQGEPGKQGEKGDTGATPNLTIGTVETLEAGSDATASITGTAEDPVLNLGIPKGADGEGGGGTQSDWNVNDETDLAYVKNRPCYEETITEITWDGNTEGRVSFPPQESAPEFVVYKVSDAVPTKDELTGGTMTMEASDGSSYSKEITKKDLYEVDGILYCNLELIAIVPDKSIYPPGVYFMKAGDDDYSTWTSGFSFASPVPLVHKLDEKYLPSSAAAYQTMSVEIIDEIWNPPPYMAFSSPSGHTSLSVSRPSWDGIMEYSTDMLSWNKWDGSTIGGKVLYLRGIGNTKVTGGTSSAYKWYCNTDNVVCSGNIETLLDYESVKAGKHPVMADYCYGYMFSDWNKLSTAPELPATTLAKGCYYGMFNGCVKLTTPPKLPVTMLADSCYAYMFYGCTSLNIAPELPATILYKNCYTSIFKNCTNLITAPELPATTLAERCYYQMFYGCTNLTTVPELPATTLARYCYGYMFSACTGVKLSVTQTDEYVQEYRIPINGEGTTASDALGYMFTSTGGTFTGTPEINTTYYLHKDCTIV